MQICILIYCSILQVSVVPELVAMKDGEVQGKIIGLQDEDKLKAFVSKLVEAKIEHKQ